METVPDVRRRLAGWSIYYGWFVVAACFLASTTTFGVIYSFNVFIEPIVAQFDRSTGTVSLVFSLQSIGTFGMAAVFGLFVDRYGPRRLLVVATGLLVAGLVLVSRADSFATVVLAYGVVVSFALGITYIVSYATVPRWFHRRRGVATAVAVSGTSIGIMFGPPVANHLISIAGWQTAYLLLSLIALGLLLPAALVIADAPASIDVDPSVEFLDGATPDSNPDARDWRTQLADVLAVVRKPGLLFIFLGFLLMYIPVYVVLVHVVSHLSNAGIDREFAVLAASMIGAMNLLGKYAAGYVADRIGEMYATLACSLLVGAGTIGYIFVGGVPGVVLTTFVFGLGYGGSAVLISPLVARFFGEVNLNTLTGTVTIGFAVSGSVGPYIAGIGFDAFGSYTVPLLASGLVSLVAALSFGIAHRKVDQQSTARSN